MKISVKTVIGVVLMAWAVLYLVAHIFFPWEALLVFGIGTMLV